MDGGCCGGGKTVGLRGIATVSVRAGGLRRAGTVAIAVAEHQWWRLPGTFMRDTREGIHILLPWLPAMDGYLVVPLVGSGFCLLPRAEA